MFMHSFKQNLKEGIILWMILLPILVILLLDHRFFSMIFANNTALRFLFRGITDALLLLWLFVFLYVWPLLSRFDNTWQRTLIHALLMSIRHLPYTLGMIAADVLLVVGSYFLILSYQGKVWLEQRESKGLWGGLYCFPQFDDKQTLLNYLKEQGITEYQEWVTFRHTFSHFHLDIHPIYVEVDRKPEEGDRSDWKKLSEKGKESQSGLLSAVKYWYDPTSPEQIGLAQPVKNLLTQFVRNYYG